MFTGLIQSIGEVRGCRAAGNGMRLAIAAAGLFRGLRRGDSVAINGCCLTVVDCGQETAEFDAGDETLRRTTLGRLGVSSQVNLELATRAGDFLGGHLVSGHIDDIGSIHRRSDRGEWSEVWISVPLRLVRQIAAKGSIAVDGVSLTVVDVDDSKFSVALIPHTLTHTTLGSLKQGDVVNVETDILSKYVERQLREAGVISESNAGPR